MKRFLFTTALICVLGGSVIAQPAKITFPLGDVKVQSADGGKAEKAGFNQEVAQGEAVITGGGARAEVVFQDKLVARMDGNSRLKLTNISQPQKVLEQDKGSAWINSNESDARCRVTGPHADISLQKATVQIQANEGGTTTVWVYSGTATVKPAANAQVKEWTEVVASQQRIVINKDGSYQKSDFNPDDEKSSWLKWNRERDKMND